MLRKERDSTREVAEEGWAQQGSARRAPPQHPWVSLQLEHLDIVVEDLCLNNSCQLETGALANNSCQTG